MSEVEQELRSEQSSSLPKRVASEITDNVWILDILQRRSCGLKTRDIHFKDKLINKLYSTFDSVDYAPGVNEDYKYWGGIFNLEFSLDGGLLVAACEGKQVVLYDTASQKKIKTIEYAHESCVNCTRFLDEWTFATGSDDHFIKLWDVRNLRKSMRTLAGHSNWVKNIEWSAREKAMVSSGFDGSVYMWNLKDNGDNNTNYKKVLVMNGLMRMKLTPDSTKMIVTTTSGYIILIHNLNLQTLAKDLRSFRPNLYRLMQVSEQSFPIATTYNYLFKPNRKRNRIEFIDDFPNEAGVISSLQVHPHGWCAVSRNLNEAETNEWTVIHDIQDRDEKEYEKAYSYTDELGNEYAEGEPVNQRPTDIWIGYTCVEERNRNNFERQVEQDMGIVNSGLIGFNASHNAYFQEHPEDKNKIIQNIPRMTHFIQEKSVGKGFIKALSFSSDGRVISSPYGRGLRILGFSEKCLELSDCVPHDPQQLKTVVALNDYHNGVVLSSKFSPRNYQLVSGSLDCEIKWYQPVL